VTLAGLLSAARAPGRSADGTLDLDLLVVCDAPALDVDAAATLSSRSPTGPGWCSAATPPSLWSAGPGRVFADLLAAKACPAVASRTPDFGPIGELGLGGRRGRAAAGGGAGQGGRDRHGQGRAEAVHRALQLMGDSIPRALGIPAEQVRVLTPGHGGPAGTRALNAALKQRFNPGPGTFGGFDAGDLVVHSPGPARPAPARCGPAGPRGCCWTARARRCGWPASRSAPSGTAGR